MSAAPLAAAATAAGIAEARPSAIRVAGVSKIYKVYDRPFDVLREAFTGRARHRERSALRDISFEVGQGEIVGVIGRNGAGKSTLLKLIAGTLSPTAGSIAIEGRVSAILELGTGFNPRYSGRENVMLSAQMRGLSEAAIRAKFDDIVAFAGLEHVIDEAFHTYSSGMQARLAFAAAVAVDADVLIIDEALAAGDVRFAARCLERILQVCESGVTALFVSHQTYQVMQLCSRALWIHDGRLRMAGPAVEIVRAYEYEMHELIARDQGRMGVVVAGPPQADPPPDPPPPAGPAAAEDAGTLSEPEPPAPDPAPAPVAHADATPAPAADKSDAAPPWRARRFSSGQYRILDIAFLDRHSVAADRFRFGEKLRLRVAYECLMPELPAYSCGLAVAFNRVSDFEAVMYFNTNYPHSDDEIARYFEADYRRFVGRSGVVEAVIDPLQLRAGEYYVSLGILPNQPGHHEFYEYLHCEHRITILGSGFSEPSVFYPMVSWTNGPPG